MKILVALLVIVAAVGVAAAPLGTEFTYQGILSDAGSPSSGPFDFRFLLYNADVGGSQVGIIVYVEDLAVTEGRFTTQLDFGSVFDGTALWLEVGVRDGGSGGGYTVLQPRQELTAAPFAQHAKAAESAASAGYAATAGDADTLDGQHGTYYLSWSNFTGIPGDLADGDDDTLGDLTCNSDEIAVWNGSAWNCSSDDDTPFVRTYVVGPVGTTTQNGTALRAAIGNITPPTSEEEAVLVVVEPGTYDVGTGALSILGWMTIEGAGERLTVITGSVCSGATRSGTIRFPSNYSELRHLTVLNTCDTTNGVGIDVAGDNTLIEHAKVIVSGGASSSTGINNTGYSLNMNDVTVAASLGTVENTAIANSGFGATLVGITASASLGSLSAVAVLNSGEFLVLKQSTLSGSSGGTEATAFYTSGMNFLLEDVTATATAGHNNTRGIKSVESGTLDDVRAQAHIAIELRSFTSGESVTMKDVEAKGNFQGVLCDAGGASILLHVEDSWIVGLSDAAILNVADAVECNVFVRDTYLGSSTGGVVGLASCIATWNDTTFYTNTCP